MAPSNEGRGGWRGSNALSLDKSRFFFGLHDSVLRNKEVFGDVNEKVRFREIFEMVFRLHFL